MQVGEEKTPFNLHYNGSFMHRRSFNNALTCFLSCVQEAGAHAQRQDPTVQLPYHIFNGKIGELSVSYGNDDRWTRALKFLLTHLKWLLVWTAKNHSR
jgi:beclin 1